MTSCSNHKAPWLPLLLNTALAAVCTVCYLLIIILYLAPNGYQIKSLLHPGVGTIKPTAVVGFAATLAASTSTLVTSCMEQSFSLLLERQEAVVARQIEANFDMATLQAFAKDLNASSLVLTYFKTTAVYVYSPMFLLALRAPFLAVILETWGRCMSAAPKEL